MIPKFAQSLQQYVVLKKYRIEFAENVPCTNQYGRFPNKYNLKTGSSSLKSSFFVRTSIVCLYMSHLVAMAQMEKVATRILPTLVALAIEGPKWHEIPSLVKLAESVLSVLKKHPKKDHEGTSMWLHCIDVHHFEQLLVAINHKTITHKMYVFLENSHYLASVVVAISEEIVRFEIP